MSPPGGLIQFGLLVTTKFSGTNMLSQVLIVDLDYVFSLLVETKFISTYMLVYNDVRLGFDNSCSFRVN